MWLHDSPERESTGCMYFVLSEEFLNYSCVSSNTVLLITVQVPRVQNVSVWQNLLSVLWVVLAAIHPLLVLVLIFKTTEWLNRGDRVCVCVRACACVCEIKCAVMSCNRYIFIYLCISFRLSFNLYIFRLLSFLKFFQFWEKEKKQTLKSSVYSSLLTFQLWQ